MGIEVWDTCHLCLVTYQGGLPAMGNWPPDGWSVLNCGGGGCGQHIVCPSCAATFRYVSVLGEHFITCYRHLTEADKSLIALRGTN